VGSPDLLEASIDNWPGSLECVATFFGQVDEGGAPIFWIGLPRDVSHRFEPVNDLGSPTSTKNQAMGDIGHPECFWCVTNVEQSLMVGE